MRPAVGTLLRREGVEVEVSPPFEPGLPTDTDREGGYGLLLLHMLTDEVDIGPGDQGGSVMRLTKRRPPDPD